MIRPALALCVAALALLIGCTPITADEVDRDVRQAAYVGMPTGRAYAALAAIDFKCSSINYDAHSPERDCTRTGGSGNILSGCVQRFLLTVDNRRQMIIGVGKSSVACAGL